MKSAMIGVGTNRTLATSKMDVDFYGKAAHAGLEPEAGNNAILAVATAILNLHAIPRYSKGATRINVGKVTAGSSRNVICDHAMLELEVRGLTSAANDYMVEYAKRIVAAAAQMHACTHEISILGEAKGDCNSPELMKRVLDVCHEKMGLQAMELPDNPNGSASEDYSFMSDRVRGLGGQSCYFSNLAACAGPVHNPHFDFTEKAIVNGVKAFAGVVADFLIED